MFLSTVQDQIVFFKDLFNHCNIPERPFRLVRHLRDIFTLLFQPPIYSILPYHKLPQMMFTQHSSPFSGSNGGFLWRKRFHWPLCRRLSRFYRTAASVFQWTVRIFLHSFRIMDKVAMVVCGPTLWMENVSFEIWFFRSKRRGQLPSWFVRWCNWRKTYS